MKSSISISNQTGISTASCGAICHCTSTGKERDEETGYGYFGARYIDHELMSGWLSVDPIADKYPSVSPYNYCAGNPVKLVDPDGREISTHINSKGKVVHIGNDDDLGIYQHSDQEIEKWEQSGGELSNNSDLRIGYTLCKESFHEKDKIDIGSFDAKNWMRSFETYVQNAPTGKLGLLQYACMAVNGMPFDPKSKITNGSQLSEGVYISPRDLGNFAAGYIARHCGMGKERMMATFGAFNQSKNKLGKFVIHYNSTVNDIISHPSRYNNEPVYASQLTYGEAGISNYFQRLGYHDIRTIDQYNQHYKEIF